MSENLLNQAADALHIAQTTNQACSPVRELLPQITVEQAYRIQAINIARRVSAGARIVGRKIGLTAKAVQKQLGVDQPDFGCLLDDMVLGNGEEIPLERLLQPKAEAEVAFVLGRDLLIDRPSHVDVLMAVEFCMAAIEIVDSRIRNWDIKLVDTVADNGSSAFIALSGTPLPLAGLDLRAVGMSMKVNGEERSTGQGAACLGHPLNAAVWLARMMNRLGTPLKAGDVIMTGALGPMVALQSGDLVEAVLQGMGSVQVAIGQGPSKR
jgi:2-keto-4-pentenoate hydratase